MSTAIISDTTLAAAVDILATVGFPTNDDYGFKDHVRNAERYWSDSLEWNERPNGLVLYVRKNWDNEVTGINVLRQEGSPFTKSDFARVNDELRALFSN